ncbi:MAG: 1,4-alpha-glucan branching protein GlgB, partial [Bacteroidota bacterium]
LKHEPALHEKQFEVDGFEWLDLNHRQESVISYKRKSTKTEEELIVVLNMTPVERKDWKIQVSENKKWKEVFNSDEHGFWGTGDYLNNSQLTPVENKAQANFEISLNLPPLGGIVLKRI